MYFQLALELGLLLTAIELSLTKCPLGLCPVLTPNTGATSVFAMDTFHTSRSSLPFILRGPQHSLWSPVWRQKMKTVHIASCASP